MELTANPITDHSFKLYVQELGRTNLYWYGNSFLIAILELLATKYLYKETVTLEWR